MEYASIFCLKIFFHDFPLVVILKLVLGVTCEMGRYILKSVLYWIVPDVYFVKNTLHLQHGLLVLFRFIIVLFSQTYLLPP